MRILRVSLDRGSVSLEDLPQEWRLVGGKGLISKILNREMPPRADPLGPENRLIFSGGPLAGTMAPQLGRISVGAKSPLTMGIKEANVGGPVAQKLDRLGIRAIVLEGIPEQNRLYTLMISKDEMRLISTDEYAEMKVYPLVEALQKRFGSKAAIICIGIGGERKYKAATISFTDMLGDPSRNAGRGGLGAVMGSKGIKAIIVDDQNAPSVQIVDANLFKVTVRSWVRTIRSNMASMLFSTYGTPFVVASNSLQGTMPTRNYTAGRHEAFARITGEVIKRKVWERGGRFHGCMPGCVVQCSIIYNDGQGRKLTAAYEYEAIAMLGTNLDITEPDAIGRLKHICDDLGVDLIEVGSCLGVAASAGKMKMGDVDSAIALLKEIEDGTKFGSVLANGVVSTAKALGVNRIPAIKGQAIPGHDPRAVKGIGVTYATSCMGADHTAGLTYRSPTEKRGQAENSLRFQIQAAVCDTFGYCMNSIPGGNVSLYEFLADLMTARYGMRVTADDVVEMGKETVRGGLAFNARAEFSTIHDPIPGFIREETLPPSNQVFDVEEEELHGIWDKLDGYKEPEKIWEVRYPILPPILFGAGVIGRLGQATRKLKLKRVLLIADPALKSLGRVEEVEAILRKSGVFSVEFTDVEPDPPIEEMDKIAAIYQDQGCDGIVAMGGGSTLDAGKATAIKVSQGGDLREYGSMVGGAGKIKPPFPTVVCIPTTAGTGSEVNPYAVITDKQGDVKFIIVSNVIIPSLAVIDPNLTKSMPPAMTAASGIDALGHCVEGYVGNAVPGHPYYEALALYGVKLVGRSLRTAYREPENTSARADMCTAAINGGLSFTKGLGIGHAIAHVLGGKYHIPHGMAVSVCMLCFVRANQKACKKQFSDLAWALDGSSDLELALIKLLRDISLPLRFRDLGVIEEHLKEIAFETSNDVANMCGNPIPISRSQILSVLRDFY